MADELTVSFGDGVVVRATLDHEIRQMLVSLDSGQEFARATIDISQCRGASLLDMLCLPVLADMLFARGVPPVFRFASADHTGASRPMPNWNKETGPLWRLVGELGFSRETIHAAPVSEQGTSIDALDGASEWALLPIRTPEEHWRAYDSLRGDLLRLIGRASSDTPAAVEDFCDAIIQQISDNVHRHSGVTIDGAEDRRRVGIIGMRMGRIVSRTSPFTQRWDEPLIGSFAGRSCLELVVVDSGEGMVPSLLATRQQDQTQGLTPHELLMFPFFNMMWKLGRFHRREGLYHAREAVERWNGSLFVRSGRVAGAYWAIPRETKRADPVAMDWSELIGTQLRILFPLDMEGWRRVWSSGLQGQLALDGVGESGEEPSIRDFVIRRAATRNVLGVGDDVHVGVVRRAIVTGLREDPVDQDELFFLDAYAAETLRADNLGRLAVDLMAEVPALKGRIAIVGILPSTANVLKGTSLPTQLDRIGSICVAYDTDERMHVLAPPRWSAALERLFTQLTMRLSQIAAATDMSTEDAAVFLEFCRSVGPLVHVVGSGADPYLAVPDIHRAMRTRLSANAAHALDRPDVVVTGHFVLPGGRHVEKYTNACALLSDKVFRRQISRMVQKQFPQQTDNAKKNAYDRICSIGEAGAIMCEDLISAGVCDAYSVIDGAGDFVFHYGSHAEKGESIVFLTPLVRSGQHLSRLLPEGFDCRGAVAVFGPDRTALRQLPVDFEVRVLFPGTFAEPSQPCLGCQEGLSIELIDRFFRASRRVRKPQEFESPDLGGGRRQTQIETRRGEVLLPRELNPKLINHMTTRREGRSTRYSAMLEQDHWVRDGRHYTIYPHTSQMLGDGLVRTHVMEEFKSVLHRTNERGPDGPLVFVYPDHLSASVIVHMLEVTVPESVWLVPHSRVGVRGLTPYPAARLTALRQAVEAEGPPRVLLIDDSANTGETMFALAESMSRLSWPVAAAFVMIDRLAPAKREELTALVDCWHAAFRIEVPVFGPHDCPHCRQRQRLISLSQTVTTDEARSFLTDLAESRHSQKHYHLDY
jgi:orotate phosphoribosyltransferase